MPLHVALVFTGCQKQQAEDAKPDSAIAAQFEKSDAVIGAYLDKLDSSETPKGEKTQILCKDYPAEYKTNYMPALSNWRLKITRRIKLATDLEISFWTTTKTNSKSVVKKHKDVS